MRRVLRTAAIAVLAIGGVAGAGSMASAEVIPDQGCEDDGDGYFGGGVCQVVVEVEAVCEGNVPYLDYRAILDGTPASTVTVTWNNPSGPGQVLDGQPLSGRLLWPGTELAADGTASDFPGWTRNADGTWVEGDAYSWAAGSVDVTFSSNPEATASVAYPAATGACAPVAQVSTGGGAAASGGDVQVAALSDTGVSATPLLGAAGGLLLAGALLMVVSRLRRPTREDG